ncbi:ferritin-like domain-containing protein [Gemmatimonas sp.]|uniref:ferritin-like domain-containing protein n=1 Tax=Gemmatimonas sp. TaxID=1962908 RepID=UPI003DA575C0
MSDDINTDAISVANDLIETCRDGEQGFKAAAERTENPKLKQLFMSLSSQRAAFKHELEVQVQTFGGKPADLGHAAGAAHRGWMAVKAALSRDDDQSILEECERGEDYAKKAYNDALQKPLADALRPLVSRQADDVRTAHDTVRDLRNQHRIAKDTEHDHSVM